MALHVLSPREVQVAGAGDHADGGGLFLRVRASSASWLLRYTSPSGRRRDMGFGRAHRDTIAAAGESLRVAREKARRARDDLAAGRDPIDAKRAARKVDVQKAATAKARRSAEALTLARAARTYHERAIEPAMNAKYSQVWIRSLECHLPAAIWHKPVSEVGAVELFEALAKMKRVLPETAGWVRRRLAAVFDDAIFFGHCTVNPASAIRRKLAQVAPGKKSANFRALPYEQVPAFVSELRRHAGGAARCLEFALLTASRTAEVRGATWEEIDEQAGVWTIPGASMAGASSSSSAKPSSCCPPVEVRTHRQAPLAAAPTRSGIRSSPSAANPSSDSACGPKQLGVAESAIASREPTHGSELRGFASTTTKPLASSFAGDREASATGFQVSLSSSETTSPGRACV